MCLHQVAIAELKRLSVVHQLMHDGGDGKQQQSAQAHRRIILMSCRPSCVLSVPRNENTAVPLSIHDTCTCAHKSSFAPQRAQRIRPQSNCPLYDNTK